MQKLINLFSSAKSCSCMAWTSLEDLRVTEGEAASLIFFGLKQQCLDFLPSNDNSLSVSLTLSGETCTAPMTQNASLASWWMKQPWFSHLAPMQRETSYYNMPHKPVSYISPCY